MLPEVWYLPCNDTPFLNRHHPVFLAIKDQVVDVGEGKIKLAHFGWVTPASCCKTREVAEEELFSHYEMGWLDFGMTAFKKRSQLTAFCNHRHLNNLNLPWFDLWSILN